MVNFTLTVDKDVLEAVRADIANAPRTIQTYITKTVPALIRKDLTPLLTEPPQAYDKFIWSYDPVKQRRAQRWYFANKVKGRGGGRYVRTHGLVNNWKVETGGTGDGAIITVSNATPGLEYVQGNRQVPSHKSSGWVQYDDVLLKAEQHANDLIVEFWLGAVLSPSGKR